MNISSAFSLVKGKALIPVPKISGIDVRLSQLENTIFCGVFSISCIFTRKTSIESGLKISSETQFIDVSKKEASNI